MKNSMLLSAMSIILIIFAGCTTIEMPESEKDDTQLQLATSETSGCCVYKSENYSVGSVICQADNKLWQCNSDCKWVAYPAGGTDQKDCPK